MTLAIRWAEYLPAQMLLQNWYNKVNGKKNTDYTCALYIKDSLMKSWQRNYNTWNECDRKIICKTPRFVFVTKLLLPCICYQSWTCTNYLIKYLFKTIFYYVKILPNKDWGSSLSAYLSPCLKQWIRQTVMEQCNDKISAREKKI